MSAAVLVDLAVLGLFIAIFRTYLIKRTSNLSGLPYPPGPKPLPIVGNVFDIPKDFSYKAYTEWRERYGELIHFTAFGDHFVIMSSERVAMDLLERRSKKYSDRPNVPMINLMGWDWNIAFQPYGDGWRQRRREFHQYFRADKSADYYRTIWKNAHKLLNNILTSPGDFSSHLRHYPGATVLEIAYGYETAPQNDRFLDIAEKSVEMLNSCVFPGAKAVNALPILQDLPAWLPGMGFKRYAQRCNKLTTEMKNAPLEFVKTRMRTGVPSTCVAAELINRLSDPDGKTSPEMEDIIKDVCAITYAAGADTTVSAVMTSILAMVLYPEARKKAQQEIDSTVGNTRLPNPDDRKSLPYVEAFLREVLRWHPVTPMSVAHSAYEDDIYEGRFIPKGATILMNTWAIHYDERTYPNPGVFKPERFLEPNGSISDRYPMTTFGMGRRLCPGRHVADAMIWAAIALVLAVFDVKKAKDEAGRDIDVIEEYMDGFISHPSPFICSIEPRSKQAETLIREACVDTQI